MRHTVSHLLLIALVALVAGCQDPVQPAAVTAAATARTGTDPLSKVHPLPADLEQKVHRLRVDLEARGFEVARGYWTLWGVEDCKYPIQSVGFCYGNNPTAPYVLAVVPRWKDEFVDQRHHHALTQAQRNMSAIYRLDEQEALVVLAELPPPARYFGMGTNVFSRQAAINRADPIYRLMAGEPLLQSILFSASPNPSRLLMLASIGNSTNDVVIERESGSPWGQQRYFVVTPDAGMADAMTAALRRSGVPTDDHVFTEPVAPALVRVGLGPEADDLITYIRYALPADGAAGDAWRAELPLTVLRVRATRGALPADPFPIPSYEPRTANYDETVLAGDLGALVGAVRTRWGQPAAPAGSFFSTSRVLDLVGQHCLGYPDPDRGPMDCLGDTQDADYQIGPTLGIDDGQVIAVVGTLGTETGNATYVSLAVNRFPLLVGVANISDTDLAGTAEGFAGALQDDARLFYVYYVARDCSGLHPCLELSRKQVPVGESIKLLQRNYINPGSARGPDPARILNPVALVLDGRRRPAQ